MSQVEDRLSGTETSQIILNSNCDKDRTIRKDEENMRDLGDATKRPN